MSLGYVVRRLYSFPSHVAEQHPQAADEQHDARGNRHGRRNRGNDRREYDYDADGQREQAIVDEKTRQLAKNVDERFHGRASIARERTSVRAATAATRNSAANPRIARSAPGQGTPRPSPVQNTPNEDSMMPTVNLSVFSGTRASGRRTAKPTAATSAQAASAPTLAGTRRPRPAPTAMTTNTTSSPSRSIALQAARPASQSSRVL